MKKQYSGRDGSWSYGSMTAKGFPKMTSATIGTNQKVRSGEKSQKTYKHPRIKPDGTQVHLDYRDGGMTKETYTIKNGKKK